MEFFRRSPALPSRLGILPGTFNPVTVAHLALAQAAASCVDEVLFVLPRAFPHKEYSGATFLQRVELLCLALASFPHFSIAASDRGLFVDIARECRAVYGAPVRLTFLCGRDAAERIAGWDYGAPGAFAETLRHFDLAVAARRGEYQPPPQLLASFRLLELSGEFDHVSATQVRRKIASREPWEHLVPAAVRQRVGQIYTPATAPITAVDSDSPPAA
jgi:nicotinate-nucleotide adenylyltransferase